MARVGQAAPNSRIDQRSRLLVDERSNDALTGNIVTRTRLLLFSTEGEEGTLSMNCVRHATRERYDFADCRHESQLDDLETH